MAYTKQNFIKGQTLKADHLNTIEDGIEANENALIELGEQIDNLKTEAITNDEIDEIVGSTVSVSSEMVDEDTGESYRLYVSNGELKMEQVV